ncbi:uncharacterized protein [Drosophila bipectinata]|uniref:uncharacterized protein n=1 Tax=Drosophila bipectinata TaxID=42026 RepID=UPI001C8A1505|nr:uncharacterized protein LOC108128834 [Drosophila bipectinata]
MDKTLRWLAITILTCFMGHGTLSVEFKECASAPKIGAYVASLSNCSKYIYCAGPGSFEAECLAGNFYDDQLDRCVDQKLVKRCQSQAPGIKISTTTTRSPMSKPTSAVKTTQPLAITLRNLSNAGPCYPYMVCYEGAGIPKACTPAQLASCSRRQSPEIITNCTTGVYGFMPHPRNCAYFYYCSNGYKLIHRCPWNYTWHNERRSCVQELQKKCYSQGLRLRKNMAIKSNKN